MRNSGHSRLTPGIQFILHILPAVLAPPCITYASLHLFADYRGIHISAWLKAFASVCALPCFLWARTSWITWLEDREIAALGAVRVPEIRGKWPGNIDTILRRMKQGRDNYPFDILAPLTRKFGPIFNTRILGHDRVVVTHPAHIKAILATEFENWQKGPRFRFQVESVLGSGVFNVDGQMWKFHRSMTRPFMSRDRISDFETFGRHADDALDVVRSLEGAPFDFQDLVLRFTLDSATEFLFGTCVNSLQDPLSSQGGSSSTSSTKSSEFGRALYNVQHHLTQRSRTAPLWPLFEIFHDKTSDDMKTIRNFINPIVKGALQRKADMGAESTKDMEHQTLLDHLVDLTDDSNVLFDETLNLLIAGRETTACLLTFAAYCLAICPSAAERLRAEIMTRVGPTRRPTIDDLREMPYLRAVLNETLRLFPPVPGNIRSPVNSTTLPPVEPGGKPFYIPAGTKVPYVVFVMHRNPDLWGPDADEFDPDRFLDERLNKYLTPNPFIFLPFNAGPRICLGQQFAYHEASFFLIRFLQTFSSIELATDAQPADTLPPARWKTGKGREKVEKIRPKSELTMYVMGGLWLRVKQTDGD